MKSQLCIDIERAIDKELHTPKDFEYLRERIYERLHLLVSSTTLKRIWGYLDDNVQTRQGTFDILATRTISTKGQNIRTKFKVLWSCHEK